MQKVYAKNPGEIVLDNPSKRKKKKLASKKDPRRVAAGKKAWKTRQRKKKQQKRGTKMSRTNPENLAKTSKQMFIKYGLAAVGTITSVKAVSFLLDKFGGSLPAAVRSYAPIAVPFAGGVVIATKAKKSNEIAQGVAGGMVYAAVSNVLHKVLPANATNGGLSDGLGYKTSSFLGQLGPDALIVKNGKVFTLKGEPVGMAQTALPAPKKSKDRLSKTGSKSSEQMVNDAYGGNWEQNGESFAA